MIIKSFAPCSDWYFRCTDASDKEVRYQLAGWAVIEGANGNSDSVIGMVPVSGGGEKGGERSCKLATVPPLKGVYVHASDLDSEEA